MRVNTVSVIGANGTMGSNVAAIFASFGDATVYMIGRDKSRVEKAINKSCKSVHANSISSKLIACDYNEFEKCIQESDLIFESAVENLDVKIELTQKIDSCAKDGAIICSGTSGLSIEKLAECLSNEKRKRYFGVHMFNPPYNMTLCELISTKYSDENIKELLSKYLEAVLHRNVVDVKDSPAFLANRIGFQFINEAINYAEKYKDNGGVDYIDAILGTFTGRAMPPIATADFVGLDVHKFIVDNLYKNTDDFMHHTFKLCNTVEQLVQDGKTGRKSGVGLYKTEVTNDGSKKRLVYDMSEKEYREKIQYKFPFAEEMKKNIKNGDYEEIFDTLFSNESLEAKICSKFLLSYILYSLSIAEELGNSMKSADDVMADGFNWCPPIALLNVISKSHNVVKLCELKLDKELLQKIDYKRILSCNLVSDYDYRRFFKAN